MTLDARLVVRREGFTLDVHLTAAPGETVVVLGPNGAGKSTALRALAGLEPRDGGHLTLDGRELAGSTPQERNVGVVFQDYRLFPHLSARENVAFPLRSRGMSKQAAYEQADAWLVRLNLQGFEGRRPDALSGGQAQRVALARALCSGPSLLLLDEPLAALDVAARGEVRACLREQLATFGGPTLLVTHDPLEALILADRLVVLEKGQVVQDAAPSEVVRRPATAYVAKLAGLNLLRGTATKGIIVVNGGGQLVTASHDLNGPAHAVIRPSSVLLYDEQPHGASARNLLPCRVVAIEALGDRVRVSLDGPPNLVADVTPAAVAELRLAAGQQVWASIKATDVEAYSVGWQAQP